MKPQTYTHAVLVHRLVRRSYGGVQAGGSTYSVILEHKNKPRAITQGTDTQLHCEGQECNKDFGFRLYTAAERKVEYLAKLKRRLIVFFFAYLCIACGAMLAFNGPDLLLTRAIGYVAFYSGALASIAVLLMIIFGRPPKYRLLPGIAQEFSKYGLTLEHSVTLVNKT